MYTKCQMECAEVRFHEIFVICNKKGTSVVLRCGNLSQLMPLCRNWGTNGSNMNHFALALTPRQAHARFIAVTTLNL
jgi:hypothetical protein